MTCIIGFRTPDAVILGGDRITVSCQTIRKTRGAKVFKRHNLVIGTAGGIRESKIINRVISKLEKVENTTDFVFHNIVEPIKNELRSFGNLKVENSIETMECGSILLGINDRLYAIYSDFQIDEYMEPYTAIGSGEDFALGSLYSLDTYLKGRKLDTEDYKELVYNSLSASAYHCSTVEGPFDIVSTI